MILEIYGNSMVIVLNKELEIQLAPKQLTAQSMYMYYWTSNENIG